MNKREAKKEACAFIAQEIVTIDERPFLDRFNSDDRRRIMNALDELHQELVNRSGNHWLKIAS